MLRSAGAIAIWTYDLGTFVGEPEATAALEKLFEERLGEYWDPRMRVAMANKYEGPFATSGRTASDHREALTRPSAASAAGSCTIAPCCACSRELTPTESAMQGKSLSCRCSVT